jgi:hypothetical protein
MVNDGIRDGKLREAIMPPSLYLLDQRQQLVHVCFRF